jgi:hypothetical protein
VSGGSVDGGYFACAASTACDARNQLPEARRHAPLIAGVLNPVSLHAVDPSKERIDL